MDTDMPHEPILDGHGALVALIDPNQDVAMPPPPGLPPPNAGPVLSNNGPVIVTTAPPQPYQPAVTTLAPMAMAYPPYSYAVQGIHPHHVSYGGPLHPHTVQLPPPPHMQMYLPPPQYQYPPHASNQQPIMPNQQQTYPNLQQPPPQVSQKIFFISFIASSILHPSPHKTYMVCKK